MFKCPSRLRLRFILFAVGLIGCASSRSETVVAEPTEAVLPYVNLGNIDRALFNEPSGIAFHPGRGTLFVVGDEGDLGEMRPDGSWVRQVRLRSADFEGVTVDPATGLVYIVVEGEERILEIDPETFEVLREFAIQREFEGKTLLPPGGDGVEAITFVPDRQGGTFYLANQGSGLDDTGDASIVVEVKVPLRADPALERPGYGYRSGNGVPLLDHSRRRARRRNHRERNGRL